jgi:UDP-N-acetylenolpyruvoylglucosamine reductase
MTQAQTHWAEGLRQRLAAETVVRCEEPLARHTTLRVGGPADVYVEPATEADLAAVIRFCREDQVPWFVIGRGSNLLVKDGGVRGVVIALSAPGFSRVAVSAPRLECGAGARLKNVSVEARRSGVAGLEFLEGIPGTVGGALRMNAGAWGGAMFDVVKRVRIMDGTGDIQEVSPSDLQVQYRSCAELKSRIALGAVLEGRLAERAEIEERMNDFSRRRWKSQPAAPSAGCMFKNPAEVPAGKLIDELGLKGARVGGAMVSFEHGNFLVNDGKASAAEILELMELVRAKAKSERGVVLEPEVQIIGE